MITFKPEVSPHKRQDGNFAIRIRVTHKGRLKRIPTTLYCGSADLTRSGKLKNGDIIKKAQDICNRMREVASTIDIFELEDRDVEWVVNYIKDHLRRDTFRLDFFEFADQVIATKGESTRRNYATALNWLERYIGKRKLDINDITKRLLQGYVEFIDKAPKAHYDPKGGTIVKGKAMKVPGGASTIYLGKLQYIFEAAKKKYNDEDSSVIPIPRSPFSGIDKVFVPSSGQSNLGREVMQKIISAQVSDMTTRIALDAFIVSFGLMGANMADLYHATPFRGDTWCYQRQKTRSRRADKAEMRVVVPDELSPFVERLRSHRGAWWLPTLHFFASNKDKCTVRVNGALKRWARSNGVDEFTFYAARHTWASLARSAGVEKATIDECLAHVGDYDMADIYAERDWARINAANRAVLELFKW